MRVVATLSGRKPRSSAPNTCSSIITSSCGTSVRTCSASSAWGAPGGCCARGRPWPGSTRAGVAQAQVDEAAGEEVLRPGVVLVGGRRALEERVELPRGLLGCLPRSSPSARSSKTFGRPWAEAASPPACGCAAGWPACGAAGAGAAAGGAAPGARGTAPERRGRAPAGLGACAGWRRETARRTAVGERRPRAACSRGQREWVRRRGLGKAREREQQRHRGRGRRLHPDVTHSVPPKLSASANWTRRMFGSRSLVDDEVVAEVEAEGDGLAGEEPRARPPGGPRAGRRSARSRSPRRRRGARSPPSRRAGR